MVLCSWWPYTNVCVCACLCAWVYILCVLVVLCITMVYSSTLANAPPAHNARTHTGKAMNVKLGRPEVMHQHIAIALAIYMN